MAVTIKAKPVLVRPAGSHHLEIQSYAANREPFSKEELHPILELDAPRVGPVRAQFSADRYVASTKVGDQWGPWRIILRDIRTPDADSPNVPHLGRPAAGIGEATRAAIREACEPVIRAWLETDAYQVSRRRTAARAVARKLDAPAERATSQARELLKRVDADLEPEAAEKLRAACAALEAARLLVDEATAGV